MIAEDLCVQARTRSFLPDAIQDTLIYWRDTFKQGYFEIGDVAATVIQQLTWLPESRYTQQEIFDEIGRFCGKSGRTVRYYYETACFYTPEVRLEYEMLPFSHFVLARSLDPLHWRDLLEYAKLHPEMSEARLRRYGLEVFSASLSLDAAVALQLQEQSLAGAPVAVADLAGDRRVAGNAHLLEVVDRLRQDLRVLARVAEDVEDADRQRLEDLRVVLESNLPILLEIAEKYDMLR